MKTIEDGWNEITEELGRDEQLAPTSAHRRHQVSARHQAPARQVLCRAGHVAISRPRSSPMHKPGSETMSEWLDRHSGRLFVMPAVLLILAFSIFPLIVSAWLALSRFKLAAGGYEVRFVGLLNFRKLFFGSRAVPFPRHVRSRSRCSAGRSTVAVGPASSGGLSATARSGISVLGFDRPADTALCAVRPRVWLLASTLVSGGQLGSLGMTLFYVVGACRAVHHRHRAGLALRPEDPRAHLLPRRLLHPADGDAGRHCLHLPYAGRHDRRPVRAAVADARLRQFRMGDQPVVGPPHHHARRELAVDPFIFIVMLAAFESQPRDEVEAAELDGARPSRFSATSPGQRLRRSPPPLR